MNYLMGRAACLRNFSGCSALAPIRIYKVQQKHWQPILEGGVGQRALNAVHEILAALPEPSAEAVDASLSHGIAGLAILCAYLARAGFDTDENAAQLISQAVSAVSSQPMGATYYGGFTGIGWAVAHLQDQLFDPDDDDPNEAIDSGLLELLKRSPWTKEYDLVSGLVGIGVYALDRLPRRAAVQSLELIVAHLDELAERDAARVTWLTRADLLPARQREQCPRGHYNLGLAHGVPGVIALLGEVCAAGIEVERSRSLLNGAVTWLLQQRLEITAQSSFPSWIGIGVEPEDCRLAWCYGDAGVAVALLAAARSVNETDWERAALVIARRAAQRRRENAGVTDAGLCHGAAGLGHIFNRLFQATGEDSFREAAHYWFEQTLAMRRSGQGIAGFSALLPDEDGGEHWVDEPGILTGASGIALALLAAATDIGPAWDRMLLVSLPARPRHEP
jgi:lantibiotic modifying enzyme